MTVSICESTVRWRVRRKPKLKSWKYSVDRANGAGRGNAKRAVRKIFVYACFSPLPLSHTNKPQSVCPSTPHQINGWQRIPFLFSHFCPTTNKQKQSMRQTQSNPSLFVNSSYRRSYRFCFFFVFLFFCFSVFGWQHIFSLMPNGPWTSFFFFFFLFFFVGEAVCALQVHTFTLLTTYALLLQFRQHRPLERGGGGTET